MFFNAYFATEALAILTLVLWISFVAFDDSIRILLRRNWLFVAGLLLITVVFRYPLQNEWFYGLEYEDSYVYTVAALEHSRSVSQAGADASFLVETCAVGSFSNCNVTAASSGHYIGWPAVMSVAMGIFGYSEKLPELLNILGACLALVSIFIVTQAATGRLTEALAASIVFATTPVFAVHGTAAYAEPASNVVLAMLLLPTLVGISRPLKRSLAFLCLGAASTALLFSVLIKRENVVLAFIFAIFGPVIALRNGQAERHLNKQRWVLACCCGFVVVLAILVLRIDVSLGSEGAEFGRFPFSIANLLRMVPVMLSAFFSPGWYALSAVLVALGSIVLLRGAGAAVTVFVIVLSYIGIYAAHLHGYYQLHGAQVAPYDMLRFAMNFASAWAILAGIGAGLILRHLGAAKWSLSGAVLLLVLYLAWTYWTTSMLRENAFEAEYWTRVNPATTAFRYAEPDIPHTYVISLEPLTIQMFGSPDVKVIAEDALNPMTLQLLVAKDPDIKLLYLRQRQYRNQIDRARYKTPLACLSQFDHFDIDNEDEFSLFRLGARSQDSYTCQESP